MRCAGHVARMGDRRGAYIVLVGRPEGKRPFERSRLRWENNNKTDPAQDRDRWPAFVNVVMNLPVSYNGGNFLAS